ncbi:hypothetical protein [Clostridium botulinum]|uniref:hypothetical protein n=1 Tax=Clostridium botulinum TaxID=1491 RepID=UPI001C9BA6FC|nr:hypothetical protein [Clostridium botulinum]MBY6838675.1 hypothetical protein [Clostridium botulinum]
MAKEKVLTQLKKGTSSFNLIGKAKVSDFTFKLDVESSKEDSDWIYNQMNLGVECGEYGTIYCDLMGGYGSDRENKVYVHGKTEEGKDDFKSNFTIDWEDRFDEEVLKSVGDVCFIKVKLDENEEKKFISQYDAIKYINDNLEEDTIVNVKGNLEWSKYNDTIQAKKTITSIVLSKAEEKDFKATFIQTVLLDKDSIGKLDKETRTIPINTYIVENIRGSFDGKSLVHKKGGKIVKSMNLPLPKTFNFLVGEDVEQAKKMLKVFKSKGKGVTQLGINGYFSRGGVNTVSVTEDDIPDDIKELIDLGYVNKDEILGQIALKNGGKKPEQLFIKSPHIKYSGEDIKMPSVDRIDSLYEEDDINVAMILESIGANEEDESIEAVIEDKEDDEDSDEFDFLNDL